MTMDKCLSCVAHVSHTVTDTISRCHTVMLSRCHTVTLSLCNSVTWVWHQESSTSVDTKMTSEGTVVAPTSSSHKLTLTFLNTPVFGPSTRTNLGTNSGTIQFGAKGGLQSNLGSNKFWYVFTNGCKCCMIENKNPQHLVANRNGTAIHTRIRTWWKTDFYDHSPTKQGKTDNICCSPFQTW
jgi:hypothetical protein